MGGSVVLAISAIAVVVGVAVWWQREAARGYAPPKSGVVRPATYRLLEKARGRLFRGSRQVRFTIFVSDGEQLTPAGRLGWGTPSAESEARFKIGEGLAGIAWEHGDSILLSKLGPFASIDKAREVHRDMFNLTPEVASSLSESQLRATGMVALCLKEGSWFKGVLCIDSLDATLIPGPDHAEFWISLSRLATDLARTLDTAGEVSPQTKQLKDRGNAWLDEVILEPTPRQGHLPLSIRPA